MLGEFTLSTPLRPFHGQVFLHPSIPLGSSRLLRGKLLLFFENGGIRTCPSPSLVDALGPLLSMSNILSSGRSRHWIVPPTPPYLYVWSARTKLGQKTITKSNRNGLVSGFPFRRLPISSISSQRVLCLIPTFLTSPLDRFVCLL